MVVGNLQILIIEPDENFQSILKRKLKRDRSISKFVKGVDDCLKLNLSKFNVILLGENTRGRSASEAYDVLRGLGFSGSIVIMTTDKNFRRSKYNGIAAAIYKPFGSDELRSLLEELQINLEEKDNTVKVMEGSYVPTGS